MLYLMPHFKWLKIQLLLGLMLIVGPLSAQQNFLEIPVKLEIEKGNMTDVVVKVKKDGVDAFTQSGASKMRLKLDFNKKYTLIFIKPGYISKTIEVNTKAPAGRISSGFDPYKIGVKLFLQNKENMVIYNQAVAKIKYDQNLDEFNFETDYSKSILSAVSKDQEDEKPAADSVADNATLPNTQAGTAEEIKTVTAPAPPTTPETPVLASTTAQPELSPAVVNTTPQVNQDLPPAGKVNTGDEPPPSPTVNGGDEPPGKGTVNGGDTPPPVASGQGDQDKPASPTYTENKESKSKSIKPSDGSEINRPAIRVNSNADAPGPGPQYSESEHITREDIVEQNRIITKVKVIRNGVETEYSRVNYRWGGKYFFKNKVMSIPENLFVQWTGVGN